MKKAKTKTNKPLRKEKNLISRDIRFKYSFFNKQISRHTKKPQSKTKQGITAHSKERNKLVETILEEDQRADLLDKDFKMTVIKIPKELKKDVEKVNKTMSGKRKTRKYQ